MSICRLFAVLFTIIITSFQCSVQPKNEYVWYDLSTLGHVLIICICVEVLQPSQPNRIMLSRVSLPNHTFTEQAWSAKWLTSIAHILSPETDNWPS